jgi:hypothetical protein
MIALLLLLKPSSVSWGACAKNSIQRFFQPMQHCYFLIAGLGPAQLYILNVADFKGVPAG